MPTAVVESLFRRIARARGARALHPDGPLLAARATLLGPPERTVDALVRPSRALGIPGGRRDLAGFAVRLADLHGPGRHQDLLLTSSPKPPLHVVLAPTGTADRAWFTSLLPYTDPTRPGDRRTLVVAHGLGDARWAFGLCRPLRRDVTWLGLVDASERRVVEGDPADAVAFDPMIFAGEDLRPSAGPVDAFREAAYAGSRDGRAG
jgi:hypothetical protein